MLKYFNYDYQAYNIKYFNNDYYEYSPNDVSNSIKRNKTYWNILKEFYNIELNFISKNTSFSLRDIARESIQIGPIAVSIDPYYCAWSPFYQKDHYFHLLLIVGMKDEKYTCFDVYYNTQGYVEVDCDLIDEHYEKYQVFQFPSKPIITTEMMLHRIKTTANEFDDNTDKKINDMYNYFLSNDKNMIFPGSLETSNILMNLLWIAEDKKHFQIALKYIDQRLDQCHFFTLYELLSTSENYFKLLKAMITKYAIVGIMKEEKLKDLIQNIFYTDEKIIVNIRLALENAEGSG
jgi:hypothetical protein